MPPAPRLDRLTARLRRALGTDRLLERIEALERRLDAPAERTPGPVYFGDDTVLVPTRWGARLLVDTRDVAMAPWLALDGLWESHVTDWMRSVVKEGMVVADIGANVGYFTLLAAGLVGPYGRVEAVEAHPRLAGILRRNIVLNGYHGWATAHHAAAWSEPTTLEFHMRDHFTSSSSLGRIDSSGLARLGDSVSTVAVPAVTVDALVDGFGRLDLVKIDVEGAEAHVLSGMAHVIEAHPDVIVMFEWGTALIEAVGDKPERLVEIVESYGFRLELLETGRPVAPRDLLDLPYGNVVARR